MATYFDITSGINMGVGDWGPALLLGASTDLNATVTLDASGHIGMVTGGSVSLTTGLNATSHIETTGLASRASTVTVGASGNVQVFASVTVPIAVTYTPVQSVVATASTATLTVDAITDVTRLIRFEVFGEASLDINIQRDVASETYAPKSYFTVPTHRVIQIGWPWPEINRGITLMKHGGVWSEPTGMYDPQLATAEYVYRGGRTYTITDVEVSELTAAGYGSSIYHE